MVAPISSSDESGKQRRLAAWAAYIAKSAKLKSQPTSETATLNASPRELASHQCPICNGELGTTPVPLGLSRMVDVNLYGELTEEEKQLVEQLRQRDAEVRRHEQAHLMAAGPYAMGNPSYTYQTGPDGQRYAVGGEVQIDLSPVPGDPEATLRKARQLQQAALAPAEPSATDRQVAMAASRMAQDALRELAEEQFEEIRKAQEERKPKTDPKADSEKASSEKASSEKVGSDTVENSDPAQEEDGAMFASSPSPLSDGPALDGPEQAIDAEPADLGPSSAPPAEASSVASLDAALEGMSSPTANLDLYI